MSTAAPPVRRAATIFIFITVLLDVLALGVVIPVLPHLIEQLEGGDTARAAQIVGLFGTMWAAMQFVCSPALGALSDRFGRRPIVLLSNLGLGLDYVVMALAPTIGWLFVGRVINGITASSIVTAFAYLADVTPGENRARAFGKLGAAFGLGFIIGPALGGALSAISPRLPFWVAAALSLLNFAYGLFVLPESLPLERRTAFSWRRANPMGSLRLLRSQPQLFGFAAVHFLYYLAHQSLQTVFVLYTAYRYGWGVADVGWALAAVGIVIAAVQGALVGPVVSKIGERATLISGLSLGAVGFAIYGVAPTGWWFGVGIPVMSMFGLYGPAAQGMMTRRVGFGQQGQLQGALNSVVGVAGIVGPTIFSGVFSHFIDPRGVQMAGAPYLVASALLAAGALLAVRVTAAPA
ncbi:MAG TPA: TCR/Tet family MFS transporter [Vicinamibacterales bacterium]|nr:TCR/Tet family MFS transporter [Vicinamibacterales bacterium]